MKKQKHYEWEEKLRELEELRELEKMQEMEEEREHFLVKTKTGEDYLVPFVLITTLFFLWGVTHSILDGLNKHFQEILVISEKYPVYVQAAVYGGYFIMAIPAGIIIKQFGYHTGIILGLILYGIGALLFIPGEKIMLFEFFLFSLFIIGCGLTLLETAANPYVTVLGDKESSERRLNLAQAFNGLGWVFGPLLGGIVLFGEEEEGYENIAIPYAVVGIIILVAAALFARVKLPEIPTEEEKADKKMQQRTRKAQKQTEEIQKQTEKKMWKYPNFTFGIITLFFYVAAQTGINSFFINYVTEYSNYVSPFTASILLSFVAMGLFMGGRMLGSWIMRFVESEIVLMNCAIGGILMMIVVVCGIEIISVIALFLCYLFESIMFPTIFALAIKDLGKHTKQASSLLVMAIVGGAFAPLLMGYLANKAGTSSIGFFVPMVCFIIIWAYGSFIQLYKIK